MRKSLLILIACLPCLGAGTPALDTLLLNTGKAVELFWKQLSAINCTETVTQSRLDKDGKTIFSENTAYDYLVLMRISDDGIAVQESRVNSSPQKTEKGGPLLATSGFSTLLFVFHPYYQSSFEYAAPEQDQVDGLSVLRVNFRQAPGARSPACLRLGGRDYPLQWSGTAWIQPQTWSILRITARVGPEMEDLGLKTLDTEVRYGPVTFGGTSAAQWLPLVATIEAVTARQHWKNVHHFDGYKHFTVETTTKVEAPK